MESETLTGIRDVDIIIMELMDNEVLNRLEVNNYIRKILNDQNFWKRRLEKRLGLISNKDKIDYKFITKFLDNGKSFEENYQILLKQYPMGIACYSYQEAIKENKEEVIDLLLKNNVILLKKPYSLLRGMLIDFSKNSVAISTGNDLRHF